MKVLFFVDRMRAGGIQILLYNLFQTFDRDKITCELLLLDDGEHYDLEENVRSMGIRVYKLQGIWLRKPTDYIPYFHAVKEFFRRHHDYNAVHINTGSKNYYILQCAKKYGIPVRIAHAHNSGFQTKNKSEILLGNVLKYPMRHYATEHLACSELAGEWLFGKKYAEQGKVHVIKNGIPLEKYQFTPEVRNEVRRELNLDGAFVVGHVGRFTTQKNHVFLIDIFEQIHKLNSKAVLLLAGIGETMPKIKEKVCQQGLEEAVRFLGFRDDVTRLTQAMDVFLMPSLYEGFPVTAVEAQAAGVPCVFSDTITSEAKILEQTVFVSLDETPENWAKQVICLSGEAARTESYGLLKEKGYDIRNMAGTLEKIYECADVSF